MYRKDIWLEMAREPIQRPAVPSRALYAIERVGAAVSSPRPENGDLMTGRLVGTYPPVDERILVQVINRRI